MGTKTIRGALCVLLMGASGGVATAAQHAAHWVATWACAPVGESPRSRAAAKGGPQYESVTIRDVVHVSLGGETLRLRISNIFGKTPLRVGPVRVALSDRQDRIQSGASHEVKFSGETAVTIPAGEAIFSDPVKMHLPALSSIAVSMYVPVQKDISLTYHVTALSANYYAPRDQTASAELQQAQKITTWVLLTGVDIKASRDAAAVVAYGDSITDGMRSTLDANLRWPGDLARRFLDNRRTRHLSVVNLGISGNRILYDQGGPSLLARFDRDVLGQSGVKDLILFAGINDIHHSVNRPDPAQHETVDDIIQGMKEIVARAHEHGIKVFGATITPAGGSKFHNPASEKMRLAINEWIRTGNGFDGWFDFDKAVRSSSDPEVLAPAYDSPDHTHLDDAGYQSLADSIDLEQFR